MRWMNLLAGLGVLASPATGGASLVLCAPQAKELWDKSDIKKAKEKNQSKEANNALNAQASKEIQDELRRLREDLEIEKKRKKEAEDGIKQYEDIKNDPQFFYRRQETCRRND